MYVNFVLYLVRLLKNIILTKPTRLVQWILLEGASVPVQKITWVRFVLITGAFIFSLRENEGSPIHYHKIILTSINKSPTEISNCFFLKWQSKNLLNTQEAPKSNIRSSHLGLVVVTSPSLNVSLLGKGLGYML